MVVAHQGHQSVREGTLDIWNVDVLGLTLLVAIGLTYWISVRSSPRPGSHKDALRFGLGVTATAVATVSPLDQMADALASAHMGQHVLLVMVAGPLIATSGPVTSFMGGLPRWMRQRVGQVRRRLRLTPSRSAHSAHPIAAWLALAGSLWFWHAAVPYQLAIQRPVFHLIEHVSFLAASAFFWSAVLRPNRRFGPGRGFRVMMIFTMAFQGVILAALITFSPDPWYPVYSESVSAWGLDPITDQQLAGLLMWIPSGLLYTGAGVGLVLSWVRDRTSIGPNPQPDRP